MSEQTQKPTITPPVAVPPSAGSVAARAEHYERQTEKDSVDGIPPE